MNATCRLGVVCAAATVAVLVAMISQDLRGLDEENAAHARVGELEAEVAHLRESLLRCRREQEGILGELRDSGEQWGPRDAEPAEMPRRRWPAGNEI